jgi:hypothetical protein
MNLIEQHMENVARETAQYEERLAQLKAEQDELRKLLTNIRRYRKSLNKQYPSSQSTLPLAPPDDDEEEDEEEATDEPLDVEKLLEEADSDPLVPGEWSPGYETPTEADALAEERKAAYEAHEADVATDIATADAMAKDWEPTTAEPEKPIRRRKAKAAAEEVADG